MPTRRTFLSLSALTGAALLSGFSAKAESPKNTASATGMSTASGVKHPVRIGSPVFFPTDDPDAWAAAARKQRNRAVYAPKLSIGETDRINAFAEAARKHDLIFAEVGRWCNLMDADPEKRAKNLANVTEGLAVAEAIGARCCVDTAGSFDTETWYGPHPKNVSEEFFDLAVENARKIIDAVKPKRARFGYEIMPWAVPDTADSYLRLLKAVDRKEFCVHLDICNMINSPKLFWNTTALINESFDKLGPWIASCHAKDLRWITELSLRFQECPLGEGTIDYGTYLKRLARLPGDVPLMIEHMNGEAEYDRCKDYLFKVAGENNVALEWL